MQVTVIPEDSSNINVKDLEKEFLKLELISKK
jgi:hypothetical protein